MTRAKIQYFAKENGQLKGELRLDNSLRATSEALSKHSRAPTQWLFCVHTQDGPFIMAAPTAASMHEWMDEINLISAAGDLPAADVNSELAQAASAQMFDDSESEGEEGMEEDTDDKRALERKNSGRGDQKRTKSGVVVATTDEVEAEEITAEDLHIPIEAD